MEPLKKISLAIKNTDSRVLINGCAGVFLIVIGGLLLNMNPPNLPVGYPTTAIGFAFFVFAVSTNNAINSAKKSDQILAKLEEIQEELKKRNEH